MNHHSRNRNAAAEAKQKTAIAEVRAVYQDLEKRPVERQCIRRTECCQFKLTGMTPNLTLGEALVAAKGLRSSGRTKMPKPEDGSCPMLEATTGKCLIYESRPFGCRTHFCSAAGGPYDRREVLDLIRRLEKVDTDAGGDGPRKLPDAIERALDSL
ncbi:MAG: YkgJ family cysteine cluster protein [Chthoniobacterales bacterium]